MPDMAFPASALFTATFVDVLDVTQLALDLDAETHKVALYTNSITGADLTTDTAYGVGAWGSNEVTGTGYTAGGATLTGTTFLHTTGGVVAWDATDPSWATATITARGALYYADALAGNNGILAQTFGADITSTAGTFTIQISASGLFTLDLV